MDNREARAEKIDMANEKWVESISAMSAEEAKKGLNEIIYSVLHDFSNNERKILIRAIAALEKQEAREKEHRIATGAYYCSVCHAQSFKDYTYCHNCGQRLED